MSWSSICGYKGLCWEQGWWEDWTQTPDLFFLVECHSGVCEAFLPLETLYISLTLNDPLLPPTPSFLVPKSQFSSRFLVEPTILGLAQKAKGEIPVLHLSPPTCKMSERSVPSPCSYDLPLWLWLMGLAFLPASSSGYLFGSTIFSFHVWVVSS